MQTIGQRIRGFRKSRGMTQAVLGERLGVSVQAVSKWENDISMPDISMLVPLSNILGVSCDSLLGGCENSENELNDAYEALHRRWESGIDNQSTDRTNYNRAIDYYSTLAPLQRKYPMNYDLSWTCVCFGNQILLFISNGCLSEFKDKDAVFNNVERICFEIINYDKNLTHKKIAYYNLCDAYCYMSYFGKAEALADNFVGEEKLEILANIAMKKDDREERLRINKQLCASTTYELMSSLYCLGGATTIFGKEKRESAKKLWVKMIEICNSFDGIFSYGDTVFFFKVLAYKALSKEFLRDGDYDGVLDCVEEITRECIADFNADYTVKEWQYSFEKDFTDNRTPQEKKESYKWDLIGCWDDLGNHESNPVIDSERYKECVRKIESL
ncbi:MAG: helix-turn-helix transcriptional regulator [Clostridia bacterium]|nr:helix-turn-helix transcriptional regulator [Clostridia bacterium]